MSATIPILYTQTGCADSPKVRDWLTEHGVAYTERNVSVDTDAAMALAATGMFATPLLVVGNDRVFGFQPRKLATLLGL